MSIAGASFRGRNFYSPGTRAVFVAEPRAPGPSDDLTTLVLIGQADNGNDVNDTSLPEHKRVYTFQDYRDARLILRGGELLEAVRLAFSPSTGPDAIDFPGAQFVRVLNINPNTAATATLPTARAGSNWTATAAVPGRAGNRIRIRKDASGYIEIGNQDDLQRSPELVLPVLRVIYTGDATAAALTISATELTVSLTGQTDSTVTVTAAFADLPTVGEVATYLNQQPGYSAEVFASISFAAADLDAIEAADSVDLAGAAAGRICNADAAAEAFFLESTGLVRVAVPAVRTPLAPATSFAYLAGGATGTPPADGYRRAIDYQQSEVSGLYRCLLSESEADQLYFRDALVQMNSAGGNNESLGAVGGGLLDSIDERRARVRTLNSPFVAFGFSPFYTYDTAGKEVILPGKFLAVLHQALKASTSPHYAATWKALNVLRPAESYGRTTESITRDGALVLRLVTRGTERIHAIDRAVTTIQTENLVYNETTSVACGLTMAMELRRTFDALYIGRTPVDETSLLEGPTEADLLSTFELKMDEFTARGLLRGSLIAGVPAWRRDEVRVVVNGDAYFFLDVHGNVNTPINHVFALLELGVASGEGALSA